MNLEDVKDYIVYKKETRFSSELPQDHEVVQRLFKTFGSDSDKLNFGEAEECLRNIAPHHKYSLWSVTTQGTEIIAYRVMDRYTEGWFYELQYKGITFVGHAYKDGEIESINHTFNIYDRDQLGHTNWHRLGVWETMEEIYNDFMAEIRKSKRKTMNHYNKLIKDVKQSYKRELKRHNDILKGDSK